MRHSRIASTAALMAFAAFALAGCKSSSSTGPTGNPDLIGSYTLVSITLAPQPQLKPPVATGTMSMTDSTYTVSITIAVPGQQQVDIQDAGTYTVSGNDITQTSTTTPGLQSVGTYTLVNNTLTVDVTAQGQETTTVWQKQ